MIEKSVQFMIEMQFMIAFFIFAMTHFLKIDVNVFVVNCHFYQWISGANYTEKVLGVYNSQS